MARKTLIEKIVKDKPSERVHPKTLIVAGLTAISVAYLATRLTSLVGSLGLVAVLSLLTAFIGEFYRMVVDRVQSIVARQLDEYGVRWKLVVEAPTEEIPPLTDEILDEIEEEEQQRDRRILWSRIALPLVVTLLAFGTVAGSYFVGQLRDDDARPIYLTETNRVTQDISAAQEERLLAKSREDAKARVMAGKEEVVGEAVDESRDYTSATREELMAAITDLQGELDAATASLETSTSQTAAQAVAQARVIEALQESLEAAQVQQEALERRLTALEDAPPEG